MAELYRPKPGDLGKNPKDLEQRVREQYREQGLDDLREVLPDSLQESLEDARDSVEQHSKNILEFLKSLHNCKLR